MIGSSSFSVQQWWEFLAKFSKVISRSCSSGLLVLEVRGDEIGGSHAGYSVGKENLLQTIGVNVLTPRGKRVCFSERVAFCFSKTTIGGEENEGGGRGTLKGGRDCLEEVVALGVFGGKVSGS